VKSWSETLGFSVCAFVCVYVFVCVCRDRR